MSKYRAEVAKHPLFITLRETLEIEELDDGLIKLILLNVEVFYGFGVEAGLKKGRKGNA